MDASNEPGSIFDILGPIMTGPSSSHTAGAVRIGKMARNVAGGDIRSVIITFYGPLSKTYKGHFTDSGVVAGLLGMEVDDPAVRDAMVRAMEAGILVKVNPLSSEDKNPNTIELEIESSGGITHRVESITVGGGEILISSVDGFPVGLRGKHDEILVFCGPGGDAPGKAGQVFPEAKMVTLESPEGAKLLVIRTDKTPAEQLIKEIGDIPGVGYVRSLPRLYDYGEGEGKALFRNVEGIILYCSSRGISLPSAAEDYEAGRSGLDRIVLREKLSRIWEVMEGSARKGISERNRLVGGIMPGDDGKKLLDAYSRGITLSGSVIPLAIARAISAMEVNASMGRVCAAPTAGSCGVIPGAISAVAENRSLPPEKVIDGLLAAGLFGAIIASRAPISGALGGCQSEIGVASAMAAAALVQIGGGNVEDAAHAMALALKSLLGLICDPVAGPVEVPCIKRNAVGVANAFSAADMALAGIRSVIPPDEVIDALRNVQLLMPSELRGTTRGGLGVTRTAERLKAEWFEKCSSCKE